MGNRRKEEREREGRKYELIKKKKERNVLQGGKILITIKEK